MLLSTVTGVKSFALPVWTFVFFFFFQAEDGIRDLTVTGVQTCALPISHAPAPRTDQARQRASLPRGGPRARLLGSVLGAGACAQPLDVAARALGAEPLLARGGCRTGRRTVARAHERGRGQRAHLVAGVLEMPGLVARHLAGDDQAAVGVQPVAGQGAQPLAGRLRQA